MKEDVHVYSLVPEAFLLKTTSYVCDRLHNSVDSIFVEEIHHAILYTRIDAPIKTKSIIFNELVIVYWNNKHLPLFIMQTSTKYYEKRTLMQ